MPTPEQKLEARKAIRQALVFLQYMEQEMEQDQYQEIPRLLVRLDWALFDMRQALTKQESVAPHPDPLTAAIQDEYNE